MTGKIRGLPQTPGKTKIRGSFTSYYSPAFQRWVIRRWPSGNGATSTKRALMNERFKTATQVIKDADPLMWEAAQEWAKNSPYLARDVLMASAMGTFLTVNMQDGTTKVSYSMTNVTIQQYLDSLSNAVGGVIVRTADGWVVLLPGDPADVLTMNGATGLPDWAPASGGGGGGVAGWAWPTALGAASGTAAATKATIINPLYDLKISTLAYRVTTIAGASYVGSIYELDSAFNITDILGGTGVIASPGALTGVTLSDTLAAPLALTAGNLYAIALSRTDSADAYALPLYGAISSTFAYPSAPTAPFSTSQTLSGVLAKKAPAIGDTFTTQAAFFTVGFDYSK